MILYDHRPNEQEVLSRLNAMGRQNNAEAHQDLSPEDVSYALRVLSLSSNNFGLVDFDEPQHLGLLYYWVLKALSLRHGGNTPAKRQFLGRTSPAVARRARKKARARRARGSHDLAIIGAGSAAAYYVADLGEHYDHRTTVLIGATDAWKTDDADRWTRGSGYINHEAHLIQHHGTQVPAFSTTYMQRQDFAEQNRRVLLRIPERQRINAVVSSIREDPSGGFFITLQGGRTLHAMKVVVATGAGPHAPPSKRGIAIGANVPAKRVMDLDTFMRSYPASVSGAGKVVVVHGPNAGIDAVERAGECQFEEILWLMSDGSDPILLPGNRLKYAPYVPTLKAIKREAFKDDVKQQTQRKSIVTLEWNVDHLLLHYVTPQKAVSTSRIDLYVYALGQDPSDPEAVKTLLTQEILEQLEPIYDVQRRYGQERRTVLGLRLPDTDGSHGLEVIGAAASAIAGDYTAKDANIAKKMERVVKSQPATVVQFAQLGAVKSSIGALTATMPRYVTKQANFSTDDRTVLMTFIAIKYPNIAPSRAERIVRSILDNRRTHPDEGQRGFHPLGYDAWWQKHWLQVLEWWNTPASQRGQLRQRHAQEMTNLEQRLGGQQRGFWQG